MQIENEVNKTIIKKMRQREEDILHEWRHLIEEIKSIPHLPINIPVDLEKLRTEAQEVEDWYPHVLHAKKNLDPEYLAHHQRSFQGQCIIDYKPDNISGMKDPQGHLFNEPDASFNEEGRLKYFVTPLGQKMPYTVSLLRSISPYVTRTRIIATPPGGGIKWHSHHNGLYKIRYLRLCIFNIPIYTNSKVIHSVQDYRDSSSAVFNENYGEGGVYMFNSWHNHEFWNNGGDRRLTIIPYFQYPDTDLLKFLQPHINAYTGPRITG